MNWLKRRHANKNFELSWQKKKYNVFFNVGAFMLYQTLLACRHMHILLNFISLWYCIIVMMSHEPDIIIIALFYCLSTELPISLSPQPDASCCPPFHFSGPLMWSPKLKENPSLLHNSSFLGSSLSLPSLQTSVSLLSLVTEWLCSTTDAFWTPFTNVFLSRDIRGC